MRRLPVCPGTAALGASGSWGLWEETERDWARGVLPGEWEGCDVERGLGSPVLRPAHQRPEQEPGRRAR